MSRQEAARRDRNDPRVAFAFGAWTSLLLSAAVVLCWHFRHADAQKVSAWALCVGVTFAAALGLAALVAFHASQRCDRRQRGELIAFLMSLLPPFVPAAAFVGGQPLLATIYLSTLFIVAFLAAWGVGEESGFLGVVSKPLKALGGRTSASSLRVRASGSKTVEPGKGLACPGESIAYGTSSLHQIHAGQVLKPPRQNQNVENSGARKAFAPATRPPATPRDNGHENTLLRADAAHSGPPEPVIAQWMTRTLSAAEGERIEGSVRVEFAPGQKQALVHVPFVPPFAQLPEVDCHVIDGSGVRVKVGTAQMYGARFEARRSDPADEELCVDIGFTAVDSAMRSDAA